MDKGKWCRVLSQMMKSAMCDEQPPLKSLGTIEILNAINFIAHTGLLKKKSKLGERLFTNEIGYQKVVCVVFYMAIKAEVLPLLLFFEGWSLRCFKYNKTRLLFSNTKKLIALAGPTLINPGTRPLYNASMPSFCTMARMQASTDFLEYSGILDIT
jgi:hypothetical protein